MTRVAVRLEEKGLGFDFFLGWNRAVLLDQKIGPRKMNNQEVKRIMKLFNRITVGAFTLVLFAGVSVAESAPAAPQASAPGAAPNCALTIDALDTMRYSTNELTISRSCTSATLTLRHVGRLPKNVMGHNWVLLPTSDLQAVTSASLQAGPSNDYFADPQSKVIAHTALIGGGETAPTITFDASQLTAGGDYSYVCTFPGHNVLMKGKLVVTD